MGEAKNPSEKVAGHLTGHEQIVLGLALNAPTKKPGEEGNKAVRKRKQQVLGELGCTWVSKRVEKLRNDPEYQNKPMFRIEEFDDVPKRFEARIDSLAWVLEQLDRLPPQGAMDVVLTELEDRFTDMKLGAYELPTELREPPAEGRTP